MNVILHADDYGYNIEVSKDIIDCIKESFAGYSVFFHEK